jgi:murein DD-endopeptidase MepM/ murein hydrolase activator NlpD
MQLAALVLVACLTLVSGSASASAARAVWERPLAGPVVRPFGLSADRYARGQHRGIDLAAPPGTAVRSACSGRVRFAGSVPAGGRTVSVACGALVATYQHLGAVTVRRGRALVAGAPVGTVGRSGLPRGGRPHLHLGARMAASGRYVDPLVLFGAVRRGVPPVGLAPRRPAPLGPAPGPGARRLAPRPAPLPAPRAPVARVADPAPAPVVSPPLAVWIGLALFGAGLPLGGLVRRRRRRRRAVAAGARARRWAAAHR